MNTKTRSALRASLKQEDAALDERLPEAAPTPAETPPAAPAAAPARKPRARGAPLQGRKPPARTATPGDMRAEPAAASAPSARPAAASSAVPAQARPKAETAAQAAKPSKAKAKKRRREAFSLAAGDLHRLDALRSAMKAAGRAARRSELVRASLAALAALDPAQTIALLDALPPLKRTTDKADEKTKGDKKKSPQRKAAARKR